MNNTQGWYNPLMAQQPIMQPNYFQPPAPKYELIQIKGEAGAKNFRMAPNSKTILVDETAPMVWFAQTDSGGYLTVEPYDISPHKAQEQINVNDLAERVRRLEEQYVQQSNTTKPRKQKPNATVEPAVGTTEANGATV